MSVLIKGMKIPERCLDCPMYDCYNYICQLYSFDILARYNRDGSIRPEWCELVELPEKHGRLIDADELTTDNIVHKMMIFGGQVCYSKSDIDNASTVIEAEGE